MKTSGSPQPLAAGAEPYRASGLALTAREDAAASRISRARFKAIEDRAVEDAIRLQERVGLPVVTDGEQRRLSF